MIFRVRGPPARTFAEENGNLPCRSRPGDRRAAARRRVSHHHICDGIARLAAEKPRREHRVRLLDQPWHDQGAAGEQDGDDPACSAHAPSRRRPRRTHAAFPAGPGARGLRPRRSWSPLLPGTGEWHPPPHTHPERWQCPRRPNRRSSHPARAAPGNPTEQRAIPPKLRRGRPHPQRPTKVRAFPPVHPPAVR